MAAGRARPAVAAATVYDGRLIAVETLARLALFADLPAAQLGSVAQALDEESYPRGHRVLRQGLSGGSFYVITDGEAAVAIDGVERARLHPGDFFGEVSVLTGEPPVADVIAASEELRCGVLPGPELRPLLLRQPQLAVRMLEVSGRRLRDANLWRS
jgi:CRP-like cAMP-binding protein